MCFIFYNRGFCIKIHLNEVVYNRSNEKVNSSCDCGTGTIFGLNPRTNRKTVFERVGVQLQSSNYQNNIRMDELCKEMSALYKQSEDYHMLLKLFSLEKYE